MRLSADSPRKYIFESFTNTFSELCAEANQNIYYLLDRYPENIIPITYHTKLPNENDFFYQNNKDIASDRLNFYSKINTFPGVPYCIVNGNSWFGNPNIQNQTKRNLDKLSSSVSPITIDVSMTKKNSEYDVEVLINSSEDMGKKHLFVILMEYQYTKSEVPLGAIGNGEIKFKWIARKMLTSKYGDEINITKNNYIHFSENVTHEELMKYNNLYAVAFVQDSATGEILQANTNFKSFPCVIEPINGSLYRTIDPNSYDKITFQLSNPNDFDVDYSIYAYSDNENLIASTDTPVVNIRAGRTEEVSINIRSNDKSFFAKVQLKVVPILKELPKYYGVKEEVFYSVYYLSNNAKFATIYMSDYSISKVADAVKSLGDYYSHWVFMSSDIYLAGYSEKLFDVLYMLVHPDNSIDYSTEEKQVEIAVKHIENNKNVIITSPASLSVLSGKHINKNKFPAENLKTLFNNYIGINLNSNIIIDINSSDTAYVCGIPNNNLSKNLDTVGIQYNYPELSTYDLINNLNDSTAIPFISYSNSLGSNNVAVSAQYNSSKIVYMGIGFEQFTQTAQIAQSLENIMIWFGAERYSKILEVATVEFNFIAEVGDTTSKSLVIKNIGSEDIRIQNIYFTQEPYGFLINPAPFIGYTIKSGDSIVMNMDFIPKVDMNVETQMVIDNESTNIPEIKISLFGYSYVSVTDPKERSVHIFPNPAEDFITITLYGINPKLKRGVDDSQEILIYNMLGELVKTVGTGRDLSVRVNISDLPKGMYILNVGGEMLKFVKM